MLANESHTDVPEAILGTNKKKGFTKKPVCPNCEYSFKEVDNWCPSCGQANRTHKRPVQYFVREFFEELVSLDVRFFGTFRDLIIKPGLLTKNYNADLRVRYTSPLRFYVITSVLFFLTISWMTNESIRKADSQIQEAYAENDSLMMNGEFNLGSGFSLEGEDLLALADLENPNLATVDSLLEARGKTSNWFTTRFTLGIVPLLNGEFSLQQYYRKLVRNFSYSLFFFMPVFAVILKILYVRRHQFYTEHLIFSIHFHTFAFLNIFSFLWIDYFQDVFSLTTLAMITIPVYLLIATKVVYQQGWIRSIVKSTIGFWAYISVTSIGFVFVLILSIF